MTYKIGAHVSAAGGYSNALQRVKDICGNCLQLFSSSPRAWSLPSISEEQTTTFLNQKSVLQIDPIYFHASYLVNFANNGWIGKQSILALTAELKIAAPLGIKGSIIHLGSYKDNEKNYSILFDNIQEVLSQTPESTMFIIENAGNNKLCASLNELGFIVKELHSPRVRVCLDTCHLWAAGYDLSTEVKLNTFLQEFDEKVGLEKLEVFQVNDSKDALGSFRDRHENIGDGTMGMKSFNVLLNHPKTKDLPFILEVPGKDKKGPDQENVERLKNLIINN